MTCFILDFLFLCVAFRAVCGFYELPAPGTASATPVACFAHYLHFYCALRMDGCSMLQRLLCAARAPPHFLSVINYCIAGGGEANYFSSHKT